MRKPDVIIGTRENPYMERWHIIPRNPWFNIYLHKISRSDDDRALHDHRADNLSIILKGKYKEILASKFETGWDLTFPQEKIRKPVSIVFRKAEQPHRLILESDPSLNTYPQKEKPVWTLWIKFGDRRDWGFWTRIEDERGSTFKWIQWEEYLKIYGVQDQSNYKG